MLDALFAPESVSRDNYAGKSLVERATGRFYTPDILADDLAKQVALLIEPPSRGGTTRLCDPFCGDGRLVTALLVALSRNPLLASVRFTVTLRDVDRQAARAAGENVTRVADALAMHVSVRVEIGDSLANGFPGTHDAVTTNPPWELLKPDGREMAHLGTAAATEYRDWLRARCSELDSRFPETAADVAWAGWGTNIARCGWELALRSCRPNGVLGIVLPSTILGDQASVSMRRSVLQRARLVDMAAYPPEAKLFDRVDQPVVAATFLISPGTGVDSAYRLFGSDRKPLVERRLTLSHADLESSDYAFPVGFGASAPELIGLCSGSPRFQDLEGSHAGGLWAGRELDETNLATKLQNSGSNLFLKGRMVTRHGLVETPTSFVAPVCATRFRSAAHERLVWRDVSRASQRRRMIGTVIPAGWVTGNSVHVAHFRDGDPDKLRALHAVLSSFVFEFQVRSRLSTGHMSLGAVRSARVPELSAQTVAALSGSARRVLAGIEPDSALEVGVAKAYGIARDTFAAILGQFPKVTPAEREPLLSKALWRRRDK